MRTRAHTHDNAGNLLNEGGTLNMFIGVHLAWSEHGRTGLAAIDGDGDVRGLWAATSDAEIVEWIEDYGADEFVLAMDAPLVVRHQAGSRPCEQALEMAFHHMHPAAYPPTTHVRAFAGGVRPARICAALGVETSPASQAARRAIEVYPDPAMIPIFGLTGTLGFRRGATSERVAAIHQVLDLIEQLSAHEVPLRVGACSAWDEVRAFVDDAGSHDQLQEAVDLVDSIICGYVAMYAQRKPELTYTFGDADTGAIVSPVTMEMKQTLESAPAEGPGDARAALSMTVSASVGANAGPASPVYLTQSSDKATIQRLDEDQVLSMFLQLRRFHRDGTRSPHRALLALTALGRFAQNRTSISPFSEIQSQLARLIGVFGPPSTEKPALLSAADTFTEL
ncbi:MAG: DUF429 domain-containing protein, partial [Nocardioidaceae bacterium]